MTGPSEPQDENYIVDASECETFSSTSTLTSTHTFKSNPESASTATSKPTFSHLQQSTQPYSTTTITPPTLCVFQVSTSTTLTPTHNPATVVPRIHEPNHPHQRSLIWPMTSRNPEMVDNAPSSQSSLFH
ncbi:hypothetical protein CC86DRAFT_85749 [Ophiobolus disseminans]|uniref:Uncharacterized protein n=1 Tax=Ophiobolus disseminans TaxID=1469910 RepID=A0A6A7AHC7_9PLEO|nr:hypothetical protein CC86DRAFT_85749 [Ophiobolus disseminans]